MSNASVEGNAAPTAVLLVSIGQSKHPAARLLAPSAVMALAFIHLPAGQPVHGCHSLPLTLEKNVPAGQHCCWPGFRLNAPAGHGGQVRAGRLSSEDIVICAKVFAGQGEVQLTEPSALVEPAKAAVEFGHTQQLAVPLAAAKRPALQSLQSLAALDPPRLYFPAVQFVGAACADPQYAPAGHSISFAEPAGQ